ncbi:MAG: hypothetical protein ACD_28C00300G0007 [uncultured bacterium]|nr:MAG: hypothetical protein ACD_28C00300G0007 [uncultured bacterium]KKT76736.1 MAG: hypothetical protein UW70_C0014G0002 [Candidatus Peregrinibacteria bacterium GW2011_GWA2_44_7]
MIYRAHEKINHSSYAHCISDYNRSSIEKFLIVPLVRLDIFLNHSAIFGAH